MVPVTHENRGLTVEDLEMVEPFVYAFVGPADDDHGQARR